MRKKNWHAVKTLLIVAEGYHDEAFLRHVRAFEEVRGCGKQIAVKNARGKGALWVIKHAVRLSSNFSYDEVAVFFDTDTAWGPDAQRIARDHNFILLPADPCFEAMLLRTLGIKPGRNLKKQLSPFVNDRPERSESYENHFGITALRLARTQETTIDQLLNLLGV